MGMLSKTFLIPRMATDSPILPPEIVDAIIDQIDALDQDSIDPTDDKSIERRCALAACALTTKSWVPRSRFYLFHTVHLPPNDFDRCTKFSALLADPACTIIPYVRTLIIREAYSFTGMGALWFNDALKDLSQLTHVQTLSIFGARFDRMRPEDWSLSGIPFFAHMKGVTDLHLTSCQFRSPDQCLDALSVCESLESLLVRRTSLDMDVLYSMNLRNDPPLRPPPRLARLSIDSHRMGNYDAILKWLGNTRGYSPRIQHLVLERVTDTETLQVSQFLQHLGSCLESLDLTVVDISDEADTQEAFCKYIDFKHNTSLQTLYFDQLIICEPYPGRLNVARYVPEVLKTVRSPMKTLVLRVQINTVDDLEVIAWDEIISTIKTNENWSSLERVVVAGPRKEIVKQATEWMRVRLRALGSQVDVRCELLPRIQVLGVRIAPPSRSIEA